MTLTQRAVRDAKPGKKTCFFWDSDLKGFGLRITATGAKSYVLSYRFEGRKRLATLGRSPQTSLKEARSRARRELAAIRDGASGPLERHRKVAEAPTVADGVERFVHEFMPERVSIGLMRKCTVETYTQQCNRCILPMLGKLKIAAVRRRDVDGMVRGLPPVTRNRVLALASRLFTQFEKWDWRDQNTNPVRGIDRAREQARDRTLGDGELAALSVALNEISTASPAAVDAIRVAALTGLRIGEVLAIRWEDIDFDTGRLTLPETKTGRRTHDLPEPVLTLLADRPRFNACPWVLSTTGAAKMTYKTVHSAFQTAAAAAGLADVRLHDLRRTVMTAAAASGIGVYAMRDLLGHKTAAMADRYVRAVGNPVREARAQVADKMAAAMAGKPGEVVPMRGSREG